MEKKSQMDIIEERKKLKKRIEEKFKTIDDVFDLQRRQLKDQKEKETFPHRRQLELLEAFYKQELEKIRQKYDVQRAIISDEWKREDFKILRKYKIKWSPPP